MIKLKELLEEQKFSFDRKFGEPLPTISSVMEKHQSKKEESVNEAGVSGVHKAVKFWQDMFRPGPIPKEYINQLIKKKGVLPSKSHIKAIYRANKNPSSKDLEKAWKGLVKDKYVRAASGLWRWNKQFESVNEGGMGILSPDQTDVLHAIVMKNKSKTAKAILTIALKDPMFKNIDKKELLGYIDGAKQFVKYM